MRHTAPAALAATPVESAGVASRWTFGSMLVWMAVAGLVGYLLYRRFG